MSILAALHSEWTGCIISLLSSLLLAVKHIIERSGCMNSIYTAFKNLTNEVKPAEHKKARNQNQKERVQVVI
jgi:hypothetical protein